MNSRYIILARASVQAPAAPKTVHRVGDEIVENIKSVAIVEIAGSPGYYLLYCDAEGREITDTYHNSLDAAKEQATFEFNLTPDNWSVAD